MKVQADGGGVMVWRNIFLAYFVLFITTEHRLNPQPTWVLLQTMSILYNHSGTYRMMATSSGITSHVLKLKSS